MNPASAAASAAPGGGGGTGGPSGSGPGATGTSRLLQKSLAARDFYEDGASSCLPNSFVPRHRTKPSSALEEALEFRRRQKAERAQALQEAREQSAAIELLNSPERISEEVKHAQDDRDEEVMVGKFMRGEHYLVSDADVQRKEMDREEKLYAASVKVIQESAVMQSDFESRHVGQVPRIVESSEEKKERERQSDYIYKISNRIGLFDMYKDYMHEVNRLQDCVNDQEEEAVALLKEVELLRTKNDFQWQLDRNNRVKELRAKTAVDLEDLEHARLRMSSIRKEINIKYPEMSSALLFEEEKPELAEDVAPEEEDEQAFRDTGKSVFGWIIGRLTRDGRVCNILFGQFSRQVEPPADGWIFVGQNVDRNLVTTETLTDAHISASQELASLDGVASTAESDHVLTDSDMKLAMNDVITVSPVTIVDGSHKASTGQNQSEHLTYRVSGCSIYNLNGKYMEFGEACHVSKYRNLRGWSIFRVALLEIPDLNILAENCYSALKGPSISVQLDKKSDIAFMELVDRHKEVKEGTVQFKRRFAEMSRSGQRIINMDQTSQLYRNEQIRAEARSESDRMMMMILQAVSSHRPPENEDAEGGHAVEPAKAQRSNSPARQLLSTIDEDGSGEREREHDANGALVVHGNESPRSMTSSHKSGHKSIATYKSRRSKASCKPGSDKTNDSEANLRKHGYITGVDLEIKVTLSKGINLQVGSQGFPLARRETFLSEESELASQVTKYIEAREEEIFKLRVESEKVARVYLESHALLKDLDVDGICSDLFQQMRKVREATVLTAETIGAWARLCYKEKKGRAKRAYYDGTSEDAKSQRTYCVSIAYKGHEIYPQSKEMKSQSARWSRGLEKAKIATNLKYIGEYKSVEDALDAFQAAVSKLKPEQLLEEDSQGAKPVVGLRSCGKHFLVRSNAVPNDLPCECCRARTLAQPDLVVPSALEDPDENLQQFIWHGVNYLEKIWTDADFLDENVLLKKAFPDLDLKFNPMLLMPHDFGDVLSFVSVQDGKVLEYLKGRQEQVREARRSGTIVAKTFTDRELMGLPYRTKNNQRVDLDVEAAKIENEKAAQGFLIQSLKSPGGAGKVSLTAEGAASTASFGTDQLPPIPSSTTSSEVVPLPAGALASSSSHDKGALPFTPWSTLSPRSALESPEIIGRILPDDDGHTGARFAQTDFPSKALTWLQEDPLDYVGRNRLLRSFHILGQSTTLTKHKLPQAVVPDKLKESVLKRKKIIRSSSTPAIPSGNQGGGALIQVDGYGTHGDDKVKTIPTEVGYLFRGAIFAVAQMRQPVANRIDDVWCRSDVGEWKGMSKGRAMRSYEFGENVKLQGFLKNEERKRLQMLIRGHIDRDIVYTDVAAIKQLIVQAKEIRGSILALDVIQAEQFLKYRISLIKSIRKMQKMARGNSARRRVRRIRENLKAESNKKKQNELQSIAMSRKLAPFYLMEGIAAAVPKLTKTRFRVTVNFGGLVLVLSIRKQPRFCKKGFELCVACQGKAFVSVYDRVKKTHSKQRAACTCRWWQGEETWKIQLFDPLPRTKKEITLSMSQIRQHIESIDRARPLMMPEYRQNALIGKSFDRLRALFDASFVTFDGQLEHSNSLARQRAAEESCILPLLPRTVSEEVLEAVRRRSRGNLAIDRVLSFGNMQCTQGLLSVSAIDHIEDSVALKQWEPISDYEYAHRHLVQVKHHITILAARVKETKRVVELKENELKRHIVTSTEWDRMVFEDARTTFIRLDESIQIATEKIQRVMKYSKDGLANFELEEKNEKLDWKQSYEEKEDGNAWEGLNNRRKLEAKWKEKLESYHKAFAKLPSIGIEYERLELALAEARGNAAYAVQDADRYAPTLGQIEQVLVDVKRITKASIKNGLAVLSMPCKRKWPDQRRVQRVPFRNVFVRDPFVRAQKENIGLWNLMERKVMALRPLLKSFSGKAVLRCIVEIYQDPVTNWILVRINQEEKAVEESMQHLDMHISKLELSDMTNSALDTDILLRPRDVDVILSKAPNWPAVHLKKNAYVFKDVECFLKASLAREVEEENLASQSGSVSARSMSIEDHHIDRGVAVEWIPPSKRPRSLAGVQVFPVKGEKLAAMPRSYAVRRSDKDFKKVKTARDLLTYLRLHPYTGRPCLGLVHFVRRKNYCVERVTASRWFRDLAKGTPSTWCNQVCEELRYVGKRLVNVSTRVCLDHLEVSLMSLYGRQALTILIPFADLVENFAFNSPILLASLLCETITNVYSSELHNLILDCIDFQLPGEEDRRFWRSALFGEMPRLEFQKFKAMKYRGPIYRAHKFFSGRYFQSVFSMTANSDLRIELGPPIDGNFWGHVYSGKLIVVDISRDELRAFVAKISTMSSLVPPEYFGNVRLLHPNHWIELFPLLLDLIILPDERAAASTAALLDDEIVQDSKEKLQLNSISAKMRYIMDKFNSWALKTKGQCETLAVHAITKATEVVESLDVAEPWSLEFQKDAASRKLVEVRSGVWACLDLDRFHGTDERTFKSRNLKEKTLSNHGAKTRDGFNENKSVKIGTSGSEETSYWAVRFLTDESKTSYFMDLRPVDDFNPQVQNMMGEEEAKFMAAEEVLSRRFCDACDREERRLISMREVESIRLSIKTKLAPALQSARKLQEVAELKLKSIGDLFAAAVDGWFTARARVVYENSCKFFGVQASAKVKNLVFDPSLYILPEPLGKKDTVESKTAPQSAPAAASRKGSVLKVAKETASDWEKLCEVIKVSASVSFPKDVVMFAKKFEKIVAGYDLDTSTRTDAEVRLVASSKVQGPNSRSQIVANHRFVDSYAQYSSAWYPRFDVIPREQDLPATFRHPDQWSRLVNNSGVICPPRNETRVLRSNGALLLVSDPIIGPFDMVGYRLYDSAQSRSWSVVVASSGDLPKFGHVPRVQKTLQEVEDAKSKSRKKSADKDGHKVIVIDNERVDMAPLYRHCSERLVWHATMKGMMGAAIKLSMDALEDRNGILEEQLEESLDRVDALLEEMQRDADEDEEQLEVRQPSSTTLDYKEFEAEEEDEKEDMVDVKALEPGKKAAIQEVVHHSVQYFRNSGWGVKVFGIMIPADEALEGIPIEVFSQDWLRLCKHYLGKGRLHRRFTSSAFIWSNPKRASPDTPNPRVNTWIEDYDKNLGWKTDPYDRKRIKQLIRSETKLHGDADVEPYSSDVVLLLRYGDREMPMMTKWLKDRYDEYAPIRELRKQKEGREREFRISNHLKFCQCVKNMAASFRPGVEAMFNERSSINTDEVDRHHHDQSAISYFCRVLLSRFLSLRAAADGDTLDAESLDSKVDSPAPLDEAFIIDTAMIHPFEESLARFDSLPSAESLGERDGILLWDPTAFVEDSKANPLLNRPDLQPRVGQVVYELYKLHCFECKRPSNLCKFPGCRCIRQEAAANMQTAGGEFGFDEIGERNLELRGTGTHPLERSIRRYLLTGRELYNQLLPVIPGKPIGLSPDEEVQLEQSIDEAEANRLRMIEYLRVTWRALEIEGRQFRYLARRILRPELSAVLTAQDVLEAKGGLKWTADEAALDANALISISELVPHLRGHSAAIDAVESSSQESASSSRGAGGGSGGSLATAPATGALVEIPNSLLLGLLGGVGVDASGARIPVHLVSPYPGEDPATQLQRSLAVAASAGSKSQEVHRPMAKVMFDWLVEHLTVSRPKRLPTGSGDRGQLDPNPVTIKLDRQFCEGTTTLLDGSLVVVKLLYGVLASSTLCEDDMSGTPPGAIRYCPSSLFHELRPGMILLIYDMRAGVTRCTTVEGRSLARAAEAFEESETNIPAVARKVLENASLVVRLNRVGEMCTAVSLDINGIQRQAQVAHRKEANMGRFRALGRKECAFDARRDRLRAARLALSAAATQHGAGEGVGAVQDEEFDDW